MRRLASPRCRSSRPALLAALLAAVAPTAAAAQAAGRVAFGPDLAAAGWEELTFRGRPPAAFAAEDAATLAIRAESGVSVLYSRLAPDLGAVEAAEWRWRVDAGPPATDLARRGGDDRAIALYFLFADDAKAAADPPASLRAALRRGRALVYVWGGAGPAGRVVESPYLGDRGRLIELRAATPEPGVWVAERAAIREDFRRAFGREPGPLVGLAVSTDGDDTASAVDARLADIRLR